MAKRQKAASQLEGFAEDLGRLLGTAAAKADRWMAQRQAIVKQLTDVRDTASKLLGDLGQRTQARAIRKAPGRLSRHMRGIVKRAGGLDAVDTLRSSLVGAVHRKRRKMSKAARAKISAAQKARWAKQKAGLKNK